MSETRKTARPQQVAKTLKAEGFELATSHGTAIRGYRVFSRGLVVENSILKDSVWVRRVPEDRLAEVVSILEAAGYEADLSSIDIDVVVR